MARYIDAEKLAKLCDIMADKCDIPGASESVWHQFRTVVECSPTADVVEVKHGKWEETGDGYLHRECGMFFDTYLWANRIYDIFHNGFNYCPNCGADMRERSEDGKTGVDV